jgi:hypothetical protein
MAYESESATKETFKSSIELSFFSSSLELRSYFGHKADDEGSLTS